MFILAESLPQVIVYPTKQSLKMVGAVLTLLLIWVVAFLLALPNFIWRTLKHHVINLPDLYSVNFCFEEWPTEHGRGFYSVFVILVCTEERWLCLINMQHKTLHY